MPTSIGLSLQFAGLAPGPFAGLLLADNGASVIRVDRPSASTLDVLCRGKRSLAINAKIPSGREVLKRLVASADVVIDPFRPGVMERLGLGPDVFLGNSGINQTLVYARLVGYEDFRVHIFLCLTYLPASREPVREAKFYFDEQCVDMFL